MRCSACFVALLVLGSACVEAQDDMFEADGENDSFLTGKADAPLSSQVAQGVLALVNSADLDTLDIAVGLDVRAATNIVNHRDGADGAFGTSDDDLFDSLPELDAIAWVGPHALELLQQYAEDNGFVGGPGSGSSDECLIISEYIEGGGQYNKAIELFNCGAAAIELNQYSLCLVRNNDSQCSVSADLGTESLAAGAVTTVCRRQSYHPASLDPIPSLAKACDLERAGAMTFSGDDRLLVLRDAVSVADSLGRIGYKPAPDTWANVVLDRCNFAPANGVSFYDTSDYFNSYSAAHVGGFGVAPSAGCQ